MRAHLREAVVTLGRRYVRDAPVTFGKAALAARYLNPHLRDHPRRRVTETRFGARFAVDTQDLIQRYVYLFGVWEPNLTAFLRSRLAPGDTFVDVGANVGYFSVLASHIVGDTGRVVAVEASPVFHRQLLQQVSLNDCRNVRAVNAAVSDDQETLRFVLADSHNTGATSFLPYDGPAESTFEIKAYPLPNLLDPGEIANARVIKIDVEGAEGRVIRGMAPMFDQLRPDVEIAIEIAPERMAQAGDSAEELSATLHEHGFHAYQIPNDYGPESYPPALRQPLTEPIRWRQPIVSQGDFVFSRLDAERLSGTSD
ncbi:FkbM family methyltransferase [Streptomyces sp. B1866]|uniref:FkbM family methyltransferase n=1 Tax=Streptomyces sp. B1866 TaxID=3075431 RepID=UPI002891A177|nr:FkbM family methyltransferase [Streptomyces sp. B1866]MDT3395248.1 FkbM family methyltransferase [Streptomyces sp. B1866]